MPTIDQLTNWHAANWEELSDIWSGLVGPSENHEEGAGATFRQEAITLQQAGYVFQTWIVEAFRISSAEIEIDPPYNVPISPGEDERIQHQLDGLLIRGWQGWLIESKFERVDFSPIARLHLLVESRPIGTMGLFFAARGFTAPALDAAHILRPMRVLLLGEDDIRFALSMHDFVTAVRVKWRAAVKYGRANLPIAGLLGEERMS